jgi:tellurite resistance protein
VRPGGLSGEAFLALAAVAWADERLDPDEADAIVRAAAEEGLDLDELERVSRDVRAWGGRPRDEKGTPVLDFLDRSTMSREDRVFVYAVACWVAKLDGVVTLEESNALRALGERLGIPDRQRAQAEALANQVAALPSGDRPDRYDLGGLRAKIGDRLGAAKSTRAPS